MGFPSHPGARQHDPQSSGASESSSYVSQPVDPVDPPFAAQQTSEAKISSALVLDVAHFQDRLSKAGEVVTGGRACS